MFIKINHLYSQDILQLQLLIKIIYETIKQGNS